MFTNRNMISRLYYPFGKHNLTRGMKDVKMKKIIDKFLNVKKVAKNKEKVVNIQDR